MSAKFEYKDIDQEGHDTLSVIEKADKFNSWMFNTIRPYCKGKILEIGSGTGNISSFFLSNGYEITLSDIRENYCEILVKKFSSQISPDSVLCMDLTDTEFDSKFQKYFNSFDTIFALNVVEHIEDDNLAIANCKKLLKDGGHLIILVPAYQALYNRFDKELFHYRRYSKNSLRKLFTNSSFNIIHTQYFNLVGTLGWFVSGRILNNKTIPGGQMSLYNTLVPVIKLIDKVTFNVAGLSVIVVGRK